jgi:ParB-like chromosome segregation protein Spo0J
MIDVIVELIANLGSLELADRVEAINTIRAALHEISPFKTEPVDFVKWVPIDRVYANDYNPNEVAPPEMELLRVSIQADGYTQPIVTMPLEGQHEVVDGFHRHRVGKELPDVRERIHGYLPVVLINKERWDKADRMAATIRHNRARGKHKVDSMSDIVIELKRRNWSDEKISKNLGMEPDEVLRLCQITGLAELFTDQEFSKSWDVEDLQDDFVPLQEDGEPLSIEAGRILHTWEHWECYPAGFYETNAPDGMTKEDCERIYYEMLRNSDAFEAALMRVVAEWPRSCEHYLTNERMNRIAWLGQASLCIAHGIPAIFRGGFNLLSPEEQQTANELALQWLNVWLNLNERKSLNLDEAQSKTEANLY